MSTNKNNNIASIELRVADAIAAQTAVKRQVEGVRQVCVDKILEDLKRAEEVDVDERYVTMMEFRAPSIQINNLSSIVYEYSNEDKEYRNNSSADYYKQIASSIERQMMMQGVLVS